MLCVVFFSKRHLPNDIMLPGKKRKENWHRHLAGSLFFSTHAFSLLTATSVKAATSAWPALPTWRWRAPWKGGQG